MTDPHWPRASEWLRGGGAARPCLSVLGVPLHLGSITPGRCDLAPAAIRAALERFSTWDFELSRDLRELPVRDLGDLPLAGARPEEALAPVAQAVREAAGRMVLLGGDNSLTRPACHGLGPLHTCGLLTFDAHLDLRSLEGGLTNGNPVRALLADGMPGSQIVQIGIQSFANSPDYARVARDAGIRVIGVDEVRALGIEAVASTALSHLSRRANAIYVDLDLDVLDRAFAPAAPGSRPGGLAPWEVRRAARVCGRHPKVRAMDLVEVDPSRDIADTTALTAAACLLAFAAGVLEARP